MDLELAPAPTPTPTKSDDTEIDTPPHTHIKPSSFTNGAVKNRHRQSPPPAVVAYKECLKNHAAALGGHAVDGCCEYMPPAAPTDPALLKCAACGCHRNFHRRQTESNTTVITPPFLDFRLPAQARRTSPSTSPPIPEFAYSSHTLLASSTAMAAEEHVHHQDPLTPKADNPAGRKRFRTKFSQEQKEKMHSFSEKLGWKMNKSDEVAVEEFCQEIGVTKGVLRVWMHNHKNFFGKKENANNGNIVSSKLFSFDQNNNGGNNSSSKNEEIRKIDNGSHFQNESGSRVHYHASNNVSCSSTLM